MSSQIIDKKRVKLPFIKEPATIVTRSNHHKFVFVKKPGDLVNISTWVKTGSIHEDDKINGISHFLEHLMFKGTSKLKAGEFDKILESNGAIINAATWKDYTFYYVTIPKGENNEKFKMALELHADMMLQAAIPDDEIGSPYDIKNNGDNKEKKERGVVIEEISMREDLPWTITYNNVNKLMYDNHPYQRDVIGTRDIIASIPREEIYGYYKRWYTPGNMTTIIVGDVPEDLVYKLIEENFQFKTPSAITVQSFPVTPITSQREVNKTGEVTTSFILIGFHGPKVSDLKNTIILDALSIILGDSKSSRLVQELIEKPEHPIFNVISTSQYDFKDGNTFFVQGNFKAGQEQEAKNQIFNQIKHIHESSISYQELSMAKKKLEVQFAEEAETVSNIGESIGHYMTICGDISHYVHYLDVLKSITTEDIQNATKKYLDIQRACISILSPQEKGKA